MALVMWAAACGGDGDLSADAGVDAAPPDAGPRDAVRSELTEGLGFPDTRTPDTAPTPLDLPPPKPDATPPSPDAAPPKPDATPPKPDAAPPKPLQVYLAPKGSDKNSGTSPGKPILTLARAQQVIAALKPKSDVEVRIAPGTYYGQKVIWSYTMPNHKIRFMTLNGDRNSPKTSNGHNRIYGCYFYKIGNVFNSALKPSTAAVRLVNSTYNYTNCTKKGPECPSWENQFRDNTP